MARIRLDEFTTFVAAPAHMTSTGDRRRVAIATRRDGAQRTSRRVRRWQLLLGAAEDRRRQSGDATGRLQDQIGDLAGVGDDAEMAGREFDGPGLHALGHEALEVRVDRPVLGRDLVEARLGAPGRLRPSVIEDRFGAWPLDRAERAR